MPNLIYSKLFGKSKKNKKKTKKKAASKKLTDNGVLECDDAMVCLMGDLHGDPFAFLQTIQHIHCNENKMFLINKTAEKLLSRCYKSAKDVGPENQKQILKEGISLNPKCQKTKMFLVILGDVLDNRRVSSHEGGLQGRGGAGTQHLLIECMARVNTLLKVNQGGVIWVVGNHDLQNIISNDTSNFCSNYAPRYNVAHCATCQKGKKLNFYETCQSGNFSEKHIKTVLQWMSQFEMLSVLLLKRKSQKCVCVHGWIDDRTVYQMSSHIGAQWESIPSAEEVTKQINKHFSPLFKTAEHATKQQKQVVSEPMMRKFLIQTPFWCRKKIDALCSSNFRGCQFVCKGHDPQRNYIHENIRCGQVPVKIRYFDVFMSGAFGDVSRPKTYLIGVFEKNENFEKCKILKNFKAPPVCFSGKNSKAKKFVSLK